MLPAAAGRGGDGPRAGEHPKAGRPPTRIRVLPGHVRTASPKEGPDPGRDPAAPAPPPCPTPGGGVESTNRRGRRSRGWAATGDGPAAPSPRRPATGPGGGQGHTRRGCVAPEHRDRE